MRVGGRGVRRRTIRRRGVRGRRVRGRRVRRRNRSGVGRRGLSRRSLGRRNWSRVGRRGLSRWSLSRRRLSRRRLSRWPRRRRTIRRRRIGGRGGRRWDGHHVSLQIPVPVRRVFFRRRGIVQDFAGQLVVDSAIFAVLVQPYLPNALGLDAADVARRGRDGEGRSEDGGRDSHGDFFLPPNLCINLCADTPTTFFRPLSFCSSRQLAALLSASIVRVSNTAMLEFASNALASYRSKQRIKIHMQSVASFSWKLPLLWRLNASLCKGSTFAMSINKLRAKHSRVHQEAPLEYVGIPTYSM